MSKDPAFLFYSSDFITGVSDLTMEERGQYITLLCIQHQKGRLSGKAVAIAAPNATADVLAKFTKDENGLIYNERLEFEAQKRALHSEKQRKRAKDGWEKRRNKKDATGNAAALPLENENENENIIDISINKEEREKISKRVVFEKMEEIKNSDMWLNGVAMQNGISQTEISSFVDDFLKDQELKGEIEHRDLRDIKSHFINWVKIQIKKSKENGGPTTKIASLQDANDRVAKRHGVG